LTYNILLDQNTNFINPRCYGNTAHRPRVYCVYTMVLVRYHVLG